MRLGQSTIILLNRLIGLCHVTDLVLLPASSTNPTSQLIKQSARSKLGHSLLQKTQINFLVNEQPLCCLCVAAIQCDYGSQYDACGSPCPETCGAPSQCKNMPCLEGCFCPTGYVRTGGLSSAPPGYVRSVGFCSEPHGHTRSGRFSFVPSGYIRSGGFSSVPSGYVRSGGFSSAPPHYVRLCGFSSDYFRTDSFSSVSPGYIRSGGFLICFFCLRQIKWVAFYSSWLRQIILIRF